ncbi:hypothetical protein Pth03_26340 [Planotetraspora thailandica]|uniref:PhoD-like phosphatase metallophosphatase domain-containing protein n=1 Tax=Planotetraspora thailandica TaxID=487172 RepID=A0A8J3XVR0_9ACTN|nr:hypothetical protein [Planotetraspora thailandica]GII54245.1 hypothetical protein Pth03_26340 [Planotetraspora thailandica]
MTLPLVLAGPVVRRVDASSATFWIALSRPASIEALAWAGDQTSAGSGTVQSGDPVVARSIATPTRAWGDHLFTATVTAETQGAGGLSPGAVFSYDVVVDGQGLKNLGLLADASGAESGIDAAAPARLALGYLPDHLPTFVTPSGTVDGLRLAHTSCRKPHGLGPDAMSWLDDLIADNRTDVDKRPQQLFLTGDQIYADDVAAPLLGMLQTLASELLGYEETVVMAGGAAGTGETRVALKDLPPLRRGRLCAEVAKFSTTDGASHLIGFGEFAAMYLACWSPRVWRPLPARSAVFAEVPDQQRADRHLTDFETAFDGRAKWEAADVKAEAEGSGTGADRKRVEAFALSVPKVARALANCSTYMIFDDHEVTDDWYLSAPWRTRVLTSPLGRSVIRNGLMAYAVFQAPGNDPAKWQLQAALAGGPPPTPEQKVQEKIATLLGDRAAPTVPHENDVDELLGLSSPADGPQVRFHYTVDGPRHRVAVLDTRTRRAYDSATRESPPKLVGSSLDAMLPAGPLTDGRELLVVVSAAPVLFPRIFDALVQPAAAAVFDLKTHLVRTEAFDPAHPRPAIVGSEQWDVEGWSADEASFHAFLRRLGSYPRVVLLGGDVHFASSLVCDLWTKGDDAADSRILQCTSSAARNEPSPGMRAVLRGQRSAQRLLQGDAVERLGWDGQHGVVLPGGAHIPPGRRGRLLRKPTFVPARGWPQGTTLAGDKPPDVRYRVSVLRDERPREALGVGAPAPPRLPAWNAADPVLTYAQIAAAHQQLLDDGKDPIRLMIFRSNIGIVSFTPSPSGPGEYVATHSVMSPVGDGTTGTAFTRHVVDLARSAAAAPPTLVTGG